MQLQMDDSSILYTVGVPSNGLVLVASWQCSNQAAYHVVQDHAANRAKGDACLTGWLTVDSVQE
jgi:hypothetical protein